MYQEVKVHLSKPVFQFRGSTNDVSGARSIPSLDGLRALSILAVILAHSSWYLPHRIRSNRLFTAAVGNGMHGVAVFFVLSGYLITSILLKEYARSGKISMRRFYFRRSLRIFPPFYAFIAVLGGLWAVGKIPEDSRSFAAAASYLWALYPSAHGYYLTHTWSLSVEELFYLAWPMLFLFFQRRGLVERFTIGLIVGMPFVRLALYVFVPSLRGHTFYMVQGWIDTMMVGCLLADLRISGRLGRWRPVTDRLGVIVAVDLFAFVLCPLLTQFTSRRVADAYAELLNPTVIAAAVALTLVHVVDWPQDLLGGFLNLAPMRWLGMASYSLYLWQQVFVSRELHLLPGGYLYLVFALLLSYFFVEKPSFWLRAHLESKGTR